MPLIRIQTRPKTPGDPAPARREPERPRRPAKAASGGTGLGPALAVGGLLGLVIVGILTVVLWRARPPAAPGAAVPAGGAPAAPVAAALAPGPINADYPRETQIAIVNGEPYSMLQLETAVRVSRVLGKLSGDPVPSYGDPEMKAFQVQIYKRQIDMLLIKQALRRDGLAAPTDPVDGLITGFLQKVGATEAQLEAELAANSVARADLQKWFDDSRAVNYYLQTMVMAGQDQALRDTIVTQWLTEEWKRNEDTILTHFYDPDAVLTPASPRAAPTAPAASPPP